MPELYHVQWLDWVSTLVWNNTITLSVLLYLQTQNYEKKLRKSRLLGTRPDHVRVESSSCCFPRELVSLVLPKELATLANGTSHILQSEIAVRRSTRMYQYKEVTTLKGTFTYVSSNSCSTFVDNRGPRNPISIWRSGCIIRSVPLKDKTKQHQLKWRSSLARIVMGHNGTSMTSYMWVFTVLYWKFLSASCIVSTTWYLLVLSDPRQQTDALIGIKPLFKNKFLQLQGKHNTESLYVWNNVECKLAAVKRLI